MRADDDDDDGSRIEIGFPSHNVKNNIATKNENEKPKVSFFSFSFLVACYFWHIIGENPYLSSTL